MNKQEGLKKRMQAENKETFQHFLTKERMSPYSAEKCSLSKAMHIKGLVT